MDELWTESLTPEEENRLARKIAREIKRRKLEVPAVFFLESHKPLSSLASNGLVGVSPFLAPVIGIENVRDYHRLLNDRKAVERLIRRIESPDVEEDEPELSETK